MKRWKTSQAVLRRSFHSPLDMCVAQYTVCTSTPVFLTTFLKVTLLSKHELRNFPCFHAMYVLGDLTQVLAWTAVSMPTLM